MYGVNFLGRCFNFKIFHIYVQTQKSPKNVKKSTRRVAGVLWTPLTESEATTEAQPRNRTFEPELRLDFAIKKGTC